MTILSLCVVGFIAYGTFCYKQEKIRQVKPTITDWRRYWINEYILSNEENRPIIWMQACQQLQIFDYDDQVEFLEELELGVEELK